MANGRWTKNGKPVVVIAADAGFNEADHPRAENGQFGSGSGSGGRSGSGGSSVLQNNLKEKFAEINEKWPGTRVASEKIEKIASEVSEMSTFGSVIKFADKHNISVGLANAFKESFQSLNDADKISKPLGQAGRADRYLKENRNTR